MNSIKELCYEETISEKLKVGDIILIKNEQQISADCILMHSNDDLGQCYINTSQMDGERNLKPKLAPKIT